MEIDKNLDKKIIKTKKINFEYLSKIYIRFKLAKKGIMTQEIEKSLGFELLTDSMQNLGVISSVMANHKSKKINNEYNYNFWEFKIPKSYGNFLICVCFEKLEGNNKNNVKENGYFIFPKEIIEKIGKKGTINIFESDLSGIYSREPKINKNFYFKNWKLL